MASQTSSTLRASAFLKAPFSFEKLGSIGLRIRGVFGREDEARADISNGLARGLGFMRSQIIGDDDIVLVERGREFLVDIGEEALAVDWPVEQATRVDPVVAQGCYKRCRLLLLSRARSIR